MAPAWRCLIGISDIIMYMVLCAISVKKLTDRLIADLRQCCCPSVLFCCVCLIALLPVGRHLYICRSDFVCV